MTREEREEAIQVIKNFPVESTKERKAVLTAIKALEWEPCEDEYGNYRYPSDVELTEPNMATSMPCDDAVSRQAVLDYIYNDLGLGDEENGKDVERQMELERSYKYVRSLKPVTPQPKTGKWIRFKEFENGYYHIKCSECGQYWSIDGHAKIFKHCFNCGTKMAESKE